MNVTVVDPQRAADLAYAMKRVHADPLSLPPGFYSAKAAPGVALLVDPINGAPFVFLPPSTVCVFEPQPGSGTDKLRQRMLAGVYFDQVVDRHEALARRATGEPLLDPQVGSGVDAASVAAPAAAPVTAPTAPVATPTRRARP